MADTKSRVTEASRRLLRESMVEVAVFNRQRMDTPPTKQEVKYVVRSPNSTTRCDGCAHYESENEDGGPASYCALLNDSVTAGGSCDWQIPGRISKPTSNVADPTDPIPPHGVGGARRG